MGEAYSNLQFLNIKTILTTNGNNYLITKNSITGFDRIDVVDKMGNIVLIKFYPQNTKKVNVDVSILHSDVYVVRIFTGNLFEAHKIIVQQ